MRGGGYSCLGFDVLEQRAIRLGSELVKVAYASGFRIEQPAPYATLERYEQYQRMIDAARAHNQATGYRFTCELHPQLKGMKGKRVEVMEIARRNCLGGGATTSALFQSVRVIS